MAKDGTVRGGLRPGAGRKNKSLDSKILDGRDASFIPEGNFEINEDDELEIPRHNEFLDAFQKDGSKLAASKIYKQTYKWLKTVGCDKLVSQPLVEQYAMAYARYIYFENMTSQKGCLAPHPTTKLPTTAPWVTMGQNYAKQANIAWAQIYQVVRENASESFTNNPDDEMELLLRRKKK